MIIKQLIIVTVGFAVISCGSRENTSNESHQITGSYVREYSFKVTNSESGREIGMSTIRDTIFVQLTEGGYSVSNRKWRLNHFDNEGWQNMGHSEDRPLPTYAATFVSEDNTLQSNPRGLFPSLYVDLSSQTISKSQRKKQCYKRVR